MNPTQPRQHAVEAATQKDYNSMVGTENVKSFGVAPSFFSDSEKKETRYCITEALEGSKMEVKLQYPGFPSGHPRQY
jgi:hypothetical protein